MTGASGASSAAGSPLPKWQLALVVGAPVALGLGYMYYKNSNKTSPKSNRGKSKPGSKENGTAAADKQISIDADYPSKTATTPETETPLQKAMRLKDAGNDLFKMGNYDEAIAQYNSAIETCPKDQKDALATFYQNRAAAYELLKKYSAVTADCTKALELNPKYTKALIRRARALEQCNDLESALEDVTTACIWDNFCNQTTLVMADRVLKQLGRQRAIENLANKKLIMPSKYFIKTYITTFPGDPIITLLESKDRSNISPGFEKILHALKKQNYDEIIPLCTKEIDSVESDELPHKIEILLLRATFYLLLGQHNTAIKEFEAIVSSDIASTSAKVNALIKRATIYMQFENPEKSFSDFEKAVKLDPNCSDIYHHRGQVNMLMDNLDEAKEDFKRSVDLNPNFGLAFVQKCYADYRYGIVKRDSELVTEAMKDFEKAFERFPECSECYTLYAQVLAETQEYQKADTFFAKAIEKNPLNPSIYVHKGLLQLQWNGDVEKGIEYIKKALELDEKCEYGYETLGTIEVQRGNLEEAIKLFDKTIALGRTAMELTHIFGLRDAAKTQLRIKDRLGTDTVLSLHNVS